MEREEKQALKSLRRYMTEDELFLQLQNKKKKNEKTVRKHGRLRNCADI